MNRVTTPTHATDDRAKLGLVFGLLAYGLWGVLPIYFKQLAGISPLDIVAHRVVWSLLFLGLLLLATRGWREVIEGIRPLMEHQAALDHIVIRSEWQEPLPAVRGDRSRLEHLFINLMLNGLNAMASRGGMLRLSGITDGAYVRVDIADQGDGIEDEHLQRIFEPFFTTRSNGTGLGLFSASRIAEEHKGSIAVASQPGHGSSFSIRLPAITPNT